MAPRPGEVLDGYRFIGGDPASESSWEPFDDAPKPGDIIDGYAFKGGDPGDENAWEKPRESSGLIEDVARQVGGSFMSGVGGAERFVGRQFEEAARPITQGINKVFGTELEPANPLEPFAAAAERSGKSIEAGISAEGKQAKEDTTPTGNIFTLENLSLGKDPSARGVAMQAAGLFGSMAPQFLAAFATRGASLPEQMAAGASVGGAMGAGDAMQTARETLDRMDDKKLLEESSVYRDLIEGGMAPQEARARVTREAENLASILTLPVSALGGAATGAILGKAADPLVGMIGSRMGRAGALAATSALEEGIQETGEGVATIAGQNVGAGTDTPLGENSFGNAVLGALGGAGPGAVRGAFTSAEQAAKPAETPITPPAEVLEAPSVDAAIQAAEAALASDDAIPEVSSGTIPETGPEIEPSGPIPVEPSPGLTDYSRHSDKTLPALIASLKLTRSEENRAAISAEIERRAVAPPITPPEAVAQDPAKTAALEQVAAATGRVRGGDSSAEAFAAMDAARAAAESAGASPLEVMQAIETAAPQQMPISGEVLPQGAPDARAVEDAAYPPESGNRGYETPVPERVEPAVQAEVEEAPGPEGGGQVSEAAGERAEEAVANAATPELRDYAQKLVASGRVKSVRLVGSSVTSATPNDVDLVYELPEGLNTEEAVEQAIEQTEGLDLDRFDAFIKSGERYYHVSSGAGRMVVANDDYAALQRDKPAVDLAVAEKATNVAESATPVQESPVSTEPVQEAPAVRYDDYAAPKADKERGILKGQTRTFKTEKSALAFAKQQKLKGYTPREIEPKVWALSRPAKVVDPQAEAARKAQITKARPFLFRKDGMTIDGIAEVLDANGFDVRDESGAIDATKAREIMEQSFSGPVYSPEGLEIRKARDAEARERHEARYSKEDRKKSGYANAAPEVQAAVAQAVEDDPLTIIPAAEETEVLEEISDEELAKWLAEGEEGKAGGDTATADAQAEEASPSDRQADDRASQPEDALATETPADAGVSASEGFALEGETETQIRTREAQEQQQAEDSKKRDRAPAASSFTLTGSDRPADEARARGQQELSAPMAAAASALRSAAEAIERAVEPAANTEDSGAELTYNKRNRIRTGIKWDDLADKNETLRVAETTKQNVYPRPDYQAIIDSGVDPMVAHILKQVYDSIAAKPQTRNAPTDEDLKAYIEGVNRVMAGVRAWTKDREALLKWASSQARYAGAMLGRPTTLSSLGNDAKTLLDFVYPDGWKAHRSEISLLGGNKLLGALQPSYDESRRASKAVNEGWPGKQEAWQKRGYKVVEVDGQWEVQNKYGRKLDEAPTEDAAKDKARELTKRESKDQISDKGISVLAAERVGESRRMEGEDISSDKLKDTFGFKGVNFGNWMKGDTPAKRAERQLHLNHSYDAFLDLADILGVPPKAVSLNGMLGLAIGAQGTGQYAAHFVPGVNEINLTRTSGAGSLAHEWGHALDHYFATQAGLATRTEPFLTEHAEGDLVERKVVMENGRQKLVSQPIEGSTIRPEIVAKFKAVVEAMNKRQETPAEAAARTQARASRAEKNIAGWLASIKRDFTNRGKVDEAAFDAIADKIKAMDLGDGKVQVGQVLLSPRVDELRALYKTAYGRIYPLDNVKSLQANLDHYAYTQSQRDAQETHEPQMVGTTYAANAANLDRGKGGKRYWSTNLEKFARAFDAFVSDTLEERAAKNTYLSHAGRTGETVPEGTERTAINKAIADLIEEIDTKETDKGVALFNRAPETTGQTLSEDEIREVVTPIVLGWRNQPRIEVIESFEDAPPSVRDEARKQAQAEGRPYAFFYDPEQTIYLVRDEIRSREQVVTGLLHEGLGHYGLRGVFGDRLNTVLSQLAALRQADVKAKAEEYGLDLLKPEDKLLAAEEVLAELAQSRPEITFVRKAIAAIRTFLRDMGVDLKLTDDEIIRSYILPARNFVERGQGKGAMKGTTFARRLFTGRQTKHDFVVPETPEFAGNTTGDLAVIAPDAPYIESLPIRLTVGEYRGSHRGFGIEKLEAGAKANPARAPEMETGDRAEDWARNVVKVALGARELYAEDNKIILRNPASKKALVLERRNDARWGDYYSVVSLRPAASAEQWGRAVWAGRGLVQPFGSQQPGAPDPSPEGESLSSDRQSLGVQTTKFDFTEDRPAQQGPTITYKPPKKKIDPTPFARTKPAPTAFHQANERLRERDKSTWNKARKYLRRQFAPGGLLPTGVFEEKITRDSQMNAVEFDVRHHVGRLEAAVRAEYGKKFTDLPQTTKDQLSQALKGEVPDGLPDRTREAIYAMRQYIDGMSRQYAAVLLGQVNAAVAESQRLRAEQSALTARRNEIENSEDNRGTRDDLLAEIRRKVAEANAKQAEAKARAQTMLTILKNIGEYVHRSYQAFDDPKWFQKLDDATLNAARTYLTNRYQEDGDAATEAARKAEITLHEIVKSGTAYDSMGAFIQEGKLGAKDLTVLIRRKEIAPEIRALLGEYKDPRLNYAKSATKMGRLIWNQKFLDSVRERGMGVFLFEGDQRPPGATKQLASDASESYAPLNGLWTFPDVEQGFRDALGKERMDQWYETIVQLNGMVKFGKTVLSPTTAARNWQSAFFFAVANGHFDMRHIAKSVRGLREYFTQQGEGAQLAYLREMQELGVIYDNPYAGEMMRLLADSKLEDTLLRGKDPLRVRDGLAYAQKFYQYGDDFWKIVGFENEKNLLMKHAGMSEAEAKKAAAARIRDTYPTYSMVGRAMHFLRRFPLAGTFVSFPAEIIRTVGNMMRYTAEDFKNPRMRPLAIRRMMGMSIAAGMAYGIQTASMMLLGIDDDDEEAVRDLSPTWSKNSNFLFLGRDEKGVLQYIDLSYVDPYNYFKRPVTAIMRDQPWEKIAADVFRETLQPFLGTDIAAGAIFEILSNKKESGGRVYTEGDKPWRQTADIANHLRKALQPGVASNLERTYKALSGEVTVSGKKYSPREEAAGWAGWRVSTLDPKVALYYRTFEFQDALRDASSSFNRVARNPNDVTKAELKEALERARSLRADAFREMSRIVSAAKASDVSEREISKILAASSVSRRDIQALLTGRVTPWKPTTASRDSATRRADALLGPEKRREIARRYREAAALP